MAENLYQIPTYIDSTGGKTLTGKLTMDVNTDGGSGGTRGQEAHDDYQFYYDHASGRHILHRPDQRPRPPRYSFKCILCNLIDVMIVIGCIAFLYFAITYALDLLDEEG